MTTAFQSVLDKYERRAAEEAQLMRSLPIEEGMRRRDEFLISVGPATGQLLHLLAREHQAQRVLEIGTSYGYSSGWLRRCATPAARSPPWNCIQARRPMREP